MRKELNKRLQGLERRAKVNVQKGPDRIEMFGMVPGHNGKPEPSMSDPIVIEVSGNGS